MPVYEYRCSKCGATLEALERMGSMQKHACPKCEHKPMEKIFSNCSARSSGGSSDSSCSTNYG